MGVETCRLEQYIHFLLGLCTKCPAQADILCHPFIHSALLSILNVLHVLDL